MGQTSSMDTPSTTTTSGSLYTSPLQTLTTTNSFQALPRTHMSSPATRALSRSALGLSSNSTYRSRESAAMPDAPVRHISPQVPLNSHVSDSYDQVDRETVSSVGSSQSATQPALAEAGRHLESSPLADSMLGWKSGSWREDDRFSGRLSSSMPKPKPDKTRIQLDEHGHLSTYALDHIYRANKQWLKKERVHEIIEAPSTPPTLRAARENDRLVLRVQPQLRRTPVPRDGSASPSHSDSGSKATGRNSPPKMWRSPPPAPTVIPEGIHTDS
eukprot:TRINITY_DN6309_c0_g1_i4.p1 TRINITY_DN6309_c0_g1~~TRINITY_DN6309_c0_g1_i4.p1  ORF type:complete len:272 (-),score=26.66 TRINITY_DN6309_c0_g1_i4:921-1736(-)